MILTILRRTYHVCFTDANCTHLKEGGSRFRRGNISSSLCKTPNRRRKALRWIASDERDCVCFVFLPIDLDQESC